MNERVTAEAWRVDEYEAESVELTVRERRGLWRGGARTGSEARASAAVACVRRTGGSPYEPGLSLCHNGRTQQ